MNTNKEKQYLVIKNVKKDNNLQKYIEKICEDENIQIIDEQVNNNIWMFEQKVSLYSEFKVDFNYDILLCSYNKNKLEYVNYLYKQFEKKYKVTKNIIEKINEEKKIDESEKVEDCIRNELNSHNDISDAWINYYYPTVKWSVESTDILNNMNEAYKKIYKVNMINQPAQIQSLNFNIELPKNKTKFEKLKDKTVKVFNKYRKEICGFGYGILLINIIIWGVLILKHFIIK